MKALVQIPARRERPAQREADGSCRKEQRGRYGFHRGNELRHHNRFLAAIDMLATEKGEPEASAPDIFDFAKSRHEYIGNAERLDQSQPFGRNHRNTPLSKAHFEASRNYMAIGRTPFRTAASMRAYQAVNGAAQ